MRHDTEVVIVGGGAVGLFLGCRLAQLGIDFRLLERRSVPAQHSRSIGLHPPALEHFETLGVAEAALRRGVQVRRGHAFANRAKLGSLSFARCPGPYKFVLALPQFETEALLERRLRSLAPHALQRGAQVAAVSEDAEGVTVAWGQAGAATRSSLRAAFIVGCDGKDSTVRQAADIAFAGGAYPDAYLMGDVADTTEFGADAAIYLTDEGLVESFPLPGGQRRWVVKTETYWENANAEILAHTVERRVGEVIDPATGTMLSAFGVQHYRATRFARGRTLLAGDAAHVISPIGGQGMNLGFLDAWALAERLKILLHQKKDSEAVFDVYNTERQRAARRAAHRAEVNMRLGRKSPVAPLLYAGVRGVLASPLKEVFARLFTMRWL